MTTGHFDYEGLPYDEIERLYREGWGWRAIARHFGAPDHKTLAAHAARRLPHLEMRSHAQAQRARRAREGASGRRASRRPWRSGG